MTALKSYSPTGHIGVRANLIFIAFGIPVASALGYALAWAQSKAHGLLASSICAVLASLLVGIVFVNAATRSHSRSVKANTIGALILLVALLAMRWWRAEGLPGEALWSRISMESASSWFMDGLGAVAEALSLALFGLIVARSQAREPFSEAAGKWATKGLHGELWAGAITAAQLRDELEQQGVTFLLNLELASDLAAGPLARTWQTIDVQGIWVESDELSRWLTVVINTHHRQDDGKITVSKDSVVQHWAVTASAYEALKTKFEVGTVQEAGASGTQVNGVAEQPSTPTALQPAVNALEAGQYKVCLALADAHCLHPDPLVQKDARRLCALALSRLSEWPQAFEHYPHLFKAEPTDFNALQLATTSIMSGQLSRGEAWFAKAVELNANGSDMPAARLRTAYLSALEQAGEFMATQPHLEWLAKGYMAMGVTDDTFVWTKGFPFFGEFLRKSHELLRHIMDGQALRSWYSNMSQALDADGQERLARHVAELPA